MTARRARPLKVFSIRPVRPGPHVPGSLRQPRCVVAAPTRADAVRAFQALVPNITDGYVKAHGAPTTDPLEVAVATASPGTVFVATADEATDPTDYEAYRPTPAYL